MENEFEHNDGEKKPDYDFWAEEVSASQEESEKDMQPSSVYRMTREDLFHDGMNQEGYTNQNNIPQKPKKKKTILKYAALVILLGVVSGGTLFISQKLFQDSNQTDGGNSGNLTANATATPKASTEPVTPGKGTGEIANTDVVDDTLNDDNVVIDVAKNTMPSIVSITSTVEAQNYFGQTSEQQGSGSGIIIKKTSDSLLIVTNNHVVSDAKSISVTFADGKSVEATVKGTDSTADLAVIKIKLSKIKESTLKEIKAVTIGDSDAVKVGEMAIAIGNALGYGQSVTVGYVSAKDRVVTTSSSTSSSTSNTMKLLQTDAAINPGNSGGALLNAKGELIGINSAKFASTEVEGMGYAIPITKALPIIEELMSREELKDSEKGYLGISGSNVSAVENQTYGIPLGVLVSEVSEDGAAKEAGIKAQDIITKINDIEVTDITALAERVNSYRVGTKVTLTIARNSTGGYQTQTVEVTLKGSKTLDSIQNSTTQNQQNSNNSSNGSSNRNSNGSQQQNGGSSSDGSSDFNIWDYFQ